MTSSAKPTVVWVPGLLHTPAFFEPINNALAKLSIHGICVSMPNYGPDAASSEPYDDVKAVRAVVEALVDEGKEVILIGHSYGGVPACQSVRGLEKNQRVKDGKAGGIVRVIFMAAFVIPEGTSTFQYTGGNLPPPWAEVEVRII